MARCKYDGVRAGLFPAEAGPTEYTVYTRGTGGRPSHRSVGASLLANASSQPISSSLTHRHRGQGGTPPQALLQFLRRSKRYRQQAIRRSVGAGLLAKASCQSISTSLPHRLRQQAGSYRRCGGSVGVQRLMPVPLKRSPEARLTPLSTNPSSSRLGSDRASSPAMASTRGALLQAPKADWRSPGLSR